MKRHDTELDGRHQTVRHDVIHAPVLEPIGRPKVTGDEVGGPIDVLDVEGLVQAVFLVEPGDDRRRQPLLLVPRPTRDRVHEGECDDRDDEQDRDDPQDPPRDIGDHGLTPFDRAGRLFRT